MTSETRALGVGADAGEISDAPGDVGREGTPGAPGGPGSSGGPTGGVRAWARDHLAVWIAAPDLWAFAAIGLAVLLANGLYLAGVFDPNPLHFRAGLTSAMRPGPLLGKPWIDPAYALTSQAISHRGVLDLLHGHVPWWNPYEATGMPLVGESQSAPLFPPTLLTGFSNGQLFERLLLEFIAGICTFRLLRRLGLGRAASTAGAIAYALNGKFAWFADGTINPLPFLPMVLLGLERAYAATVAGRGGGWRLLAVAGALSVYAGFPEVAYPNTLLALCWAGWRCTCLERRQLGTFLAKGGLGAIAGALLAAPELLAIASYLSRADLGIHATVNLGNWHLGHSALPSLLMPYVYGQVNGGVPQVTLWFKVGGYLSSTLLLFAIMGCLAPGRRGLKIMLVTWSLIVLSRMYGTPPLLGDILGVLPGMSKMQFYRYATAALELPVIVLAALGVDALLDSTAPRRRLLWAIPITVAAVVGAWFEARPHVHPLGGPFRQGTFLNASLVWALVGVMLATAIVFVPRRRARAALLTALVALDALVLFVVPEFAAPRSTRLDLAPVTYLRAHLGEGRFFSLGPVQANYGSYFGLASFGIEDFPPKAYAAYVRAHADPAIVFAGFRDPGAPLPQAELLSHLDGYRSAGVRYVLTPTGDPLPEGRTGLRLAATTPTTLIYRLSQAAPYVDAAGCAVSSSERTNVTVRCVRPSTLIRRETWLPGWHADLDGRPVPIQQADGIFQAVQVPAGSHTLVFDFVPPGMGWAVLAFAGGCVLMLASPARRFAGRARQRFGPTYRSSTATL